MATLASLLLQDAAAAMSELNILFKYLEAMGTLKVQMARFNPPAVSRVLI